MIEKMGFEKNKRIHKKYKNVWVFGTLNGRECHFRSKLEHKLAKYLELLINNGHIKDAFHEDTTFKFPDSSWLVDFSVRNNDDTFEYFECKGFVEADTKRKLNLLGKYRPEVEVTMVISDKKGVDKLGVRATSCCKRVCTIAEITKGVF